MRKIKTQIFITHIRTFLFHMRSQHFPQSIIQQMRSSMIIRRQHPLILIHLGNKSLKNIFWQFLYNMNRQTIFFFGVQNPYFLMFTDQQTTISYLSATFCIKRCYIENKMIKQLIFSNNLSITSYLHFHFRIIITNKFLHIVINQLYPVIRINRSSRT